MFETKVPWTFKTWILRFQGVDLPIGDLAGDVTKDPDFPEEDYFDELLAHIQEKSHNNADVVETFVLAWGYYLASRDDSRPDPKLTTE